jgi:hypothetical protein
MTIQHSAIQDPQIHEPKGVATATSGDVYQADGAGSGDWVSKTAWYTWKDGQYTSSAKRSITSTTRTKVTINGSALTDGNGTSGSSFWNTSTNKIVSEDEDYVYEIRFDFKAHSATASAYVDVEFDVGGTSNTILTYTHILTKTAATNFVVVNSPFFVDADFNTNGCEIYVTPSANTDFWDFGIFITRVHRGIS